MLLIKSKALTKIFAFSTFLWVYLPLSFLDSAKNRLEYNLQWFMSTAAKANACSHIIQLKKLPPNTLFYTETTVLVLMYSRISFPIPLVTAYYIAAGAAMQALRCSVTNCLKKFLLFTQALFFFKTFDILIAPYTFLLFNCFNFLVKQCKAAPAWGIFSKTYILLLTLQITVYSITVICMTCTVLQKLFPRDSYS